MNTLNDSLLRVDHIYYFYRKAKDAINQTEHEYCVHIYRCIQLLEKCLNDFLMVKIVPALITFVPGIQILGQYICVKMHHDVRMPGFLIFPLLTIDAALINIIIFTLASRVNSVSIKVLATHEKYSSKFKRTSAIKKSIRACAVLKIKFGSNYIDNGTPLVIQNFCADQTMSLILIGSW